MATRAILHYNSTESTQKTILFLFIYLYIYRMIRIYYSRLILDVLLWLNARIAAS
jgi:hypothetical protein